jgi:hypothetical protein
LADGSTERDHLEGARRAGELVPELDVPDIPAGCQQIWIVFLQLNACRGSTGMGPAAIGPCDLLAWQQLQRVEFTPWEIDMLMALDRVALQSADTAKTVTAKE